MEKETLKEESEVKRFRELMKACNKLNQPNTQARTELKKMVKNNEACKDIMRKQKDLFAVTLKHRIESMQASDLFKELMQFKCDQLKEELGYSSSNKLEKIAIEHIILCWMDYHQTENDFNNILAQSPETELGIYWEKRLTYSSRRYTRAIESLVKIRKMNLTFQINTAKNQIIHTITN